MKQSFYWTTFNIFLIFYFIIQICAEQPIWLLGLTFIIFFNIFFIKTTLYYLNYSYNLNNYQVKLYIKFLN